MYKTKTFLFFFLLLAFKLSGQYQFTKANIAQMNGEFRLAINLFYQQNDVDDNLLNLASAYSYLEMRDSALFFLNRQRELYQLPITVLCLPDFISLNDEPQWKEMSTNLREKYFKENPQLNRKLVEKIWLLYIDDQFYRGAKEFYKSKFGGGKTGLDSIELLQARLDSANLLKLGRILDEYGWPKRSEVGDGITESVPFLVIQHARDISVQKKYLPVLKKLVDEGEADSRSFAYLTDRVLVKEGKKQRYGTQLEENKESGKTELCPIEDEANVDKLRKEIGLEPLKDYLQMFGIKYEK